MSFLNCVDMLMAEVICLYVFSSKVEKLLNCVFRNSLLLLCFALVVVKVDSDAGYCVGIYQSFWSLCFSGPGGLRQTPGQGGSNTSAVRAGTDTILSLSLLIQITCNLFPQKNYM